MGERSRPGGGLGHSAEGPLALSTSKASELDGGARWAVIRVCVAAHGESDFENLFSYLPPDALHVLAYLGDDLVGHAVVSTRWLQPSHLPLLRTAYVDAVATSPHRRGRGIGSAVMQHLEAVVGHYDVACLETERPAFYERLGWEEWRGPAGGVVRRGTDPDARADGVMVLRLSRTPQLDLDSLLTIEASPARIW